MFVCFRVLDKPVVDAGTAAGGHRSRASTVTTDRPVTLGAAAPTQMASHLRMMSSIRGEGGNGTRARFDDSEASNPHVDAVLRMLGKDLEQVVQQSTVDIVDDGESTSDSEDNNNNNNAPRVARCGACETFLSVPEGVRVFACGHCQQALKVLSVSD